MRKLALIATLTAAAVAAAPSSSAKPAPLVPPFIQKLVRAKAGALAYMPTRSPFGYRYSAYRWDGRMLTIKLADRRFPVDGRHSISVSAQRFGGPLASCGDGREKTLQMGGNKVYWDGQTAWRCVRGPNGRLFKLFASGPNLPDVALGRVMASVKRVA